MTFSSCFLAYFPHNGLLLSLPLCVRRSRKGSEQKLSETVAEAADALVHIVQYSDTLAGIALRYNVSVCVRLCVSSVLTLVLTG